MKPTPIQLLTPLCGRQVVTSALGCNDRGLKARIEDGRIEYAFDLSCRSDSRPCIRVFTPCLAADWGTTGRVAFPDLAIVLAAVLPFTKNPTARELADRFSCSSAHSLNLLREGFLQSGGSRCRRGPKGSPLIDLASVRDFMKARRLL